MHFFEVFVFYTKDAKRKRGEMVPQRFLDRAPAVYYKCSPCTFNSFPLSLSPDVLMDCSTSKGKAKRNELVLAPLAGSSLAARP